MNHNDITTLITSRNDIAIGASDDRTRDRVHVGDAEGVRVDDKTRFGVVQCDAITFCNLDKSKAVKMSSILTYQSQTVTNDRSKAKQNSVANTKGTKYHQYY